MWKKIPFFISVFPLAYLSFAQQAKTTFSCIDDSYDKVKVALTAPNGHCEVRNGTTLQPVSIYKSENAETDHSYEESISGRTKEIKIRIGNQEDQPLSAAISKKLFSTQEVDKYSWKVFLSPIKPMDLNLIYAVGDTHLDLSDLPIERLKLRTGSANVLLNYKNGEGNRIQMDTLMINVDMGSLETKNLHLARSERIIADVGFGSVRLDFEKATTCTTTVDATVGAGKLVVLLPTTALPIKININDSPMCRITIPANFIRISDTEFVSDKTTPQGTGYITFNVDVAVGKVDFMALEK